MHDIFVLGTFCFKLGRSHYGAMGRYNCIFLRHVSILEINDYNCIETNVKYSVTQQHCFNVQVMEWEDASRLRKIKIRIKPAKEPILESIKRIHLQRRTKYVSATEAAQRAKVHVSAFSRVTEAVFVTKDLGEDRRWKQNFGLHLKFNKTDQGVSNT